MDNFANISCVIIVKNGAATLASTLASLHLFKEVILYDNGSTDGSQEIAAKFNNVTLVTGDFLGFGDTKNKAASYASNDWVLSLDADEILSEAFSNSLRALPLDEQNVYQIVRTNFYAQREIKYCWKKEKIVRLYSRKQTAFNQNKVHEFVISNNLAIHTLEGMVKHYPYQNISNFIQKSDHYSTLFAQENVGRKSSSPLKAVLNALFVFLKKYIIKRGFLDGYPGLLITAAHVSTNFFKYLKLYEANQLLKKDAR
jgi:glycosyltransferase involved in cell wall biosynthesis